MALNPYNPEDVQALFDRVAPSYDRLNDFLSFGLHRIWKRKLLDDLKPSPGENWLDLCCGTGDLAIPLAKRVFPSGTVLGIDSADRPLDFARERAGRYPELEVSLLNKDVLQTDLPSGEFDGVVMAYGLRNLSDPSKGLREIHRLLKPGARAGILDFNPIKKGTAPARFQIFYLRKVVVPIASVFGLGKEYSYLEKSLNCFPDGEGQEKLALEVGFHKAVHTTLAGKQMGVLLLTA